MVVCDTAHMELRMWSRVKFGFDIEIEPEEPIDQIFLCQTLEEFEEDSLRQLPDYIDRVEYEKEFIEFLDSEGVRYKVLPPVDFDERKKNGRQRDSRYPLCVNWFSWFGYSSRYWRSS